MLADAMRREQVSGAAVCDLCTGTGALAIAAARAGAGSVSAVELTLRASLCARINARLNGVDVRVRRGDLFRPLTGDRFDIIVSNPPYIPAESDSLPRHGTTVALDAGMNGRILIDRIIAGAPAHLRPAGVLLLVHSSVCGVDDTCSAMASAGLEPDVVHRHTGALGPVLTARASMLRERGLLGEQDLEDVVVVRGRAPGESLSKDH